LRRKVPQINKEDGREAPKSPKIGKTKVCDKAKRINQF